MAVKLVAILTVFMTWALVTSEAAKGTSTNGTGPACGNHTCDNGTHCRLKNGEIDCVCNKDFHGAGNFTCITDGTAYCTILNDLSLQSFDGSFVRVPWEQMTFAAHIRTNVSMKLAHGFFPLQSAKCDIKVYMWYCPIGSKFFVCGTVVNVTVIRSDKVHYNTIRIQGKARKGQYTFKESQTHEFSNGDSEFNDRVLTTKTGISGATTFYDKAQNIAYVVIENCRVEVGLRPADSVLDPFKTTPGLLVLTRKLQPNYLSVEQTVCAPPEGKGPSLQDQVNKLTIEVGEPVTKEDLICHKVICGDINQNFPGAKQNLNNFHEICNSCDKKTLIRAIQHCCFIIYNHPFVNCYVHIPNSYRGSNKLISLLDKCLFSFCSENSDMCKMVQNSVTDSGCAQKIPQFQQTILNSTCDFYSQ